MYLNKPIGLFENVGKKKVIGDLVTLANHYRKCNKMHLLSSTASLLGPNNIKWAGFFFQVT